MSEREGSFRRCETCEFYHERGSGGGDCRFNPPAVLNYHDDVITVWPEVTRGSWCGKWQRGRVVRGQTLQKKRPVIPTPEEDPTL